MLDIDIDKILNDTRENKLTFYSGHSVLRTIYRPFWEGIFKQLAILISFNIFRENIYNLFKFGELFS